MTDCRVMDLWQLDFQEYGLARFPSFKAGACPKLKLVAVEVMIWHSIKYSYW